MDAALALGILNSPENQILLDLVKKYNSLRDAKLVACAGDHSALAFEALDLDLGALLVQILPVLASLLTGGFSLVAILPLAKFVIGMFLKDTDLANALFAIIETLLKAFV